MRAIVIRAPGGPEVLELVERPSAPCGPDDVRVHVRATAVNRADLLQRRGFYPAPPGVPADVPGLELAGDVVERGAAVTTLAVGDRVFGIIGGGAYADEVVTHARTLARIPDGLGFVEAAAVPEAFMTAWDAMVSQAGLRAGDVALIHAVGSGVGTAGAQIAHDLGARVVGTSRSEAKLERAKALGVDHGLVVRDGRFAAAVLEATGGHGADVVLDLVSGAYVTEELACMAPRGRIVIVGLVGGLRADVDLGAVLRKRLHVIGTVLRSRELDERIAVTETFAREVVPRLASRALVPVVHQVLPRARAAAAHALLEGNEPFGKVVLET